MAGRRCEGSSPVVGALFQVIESICKRPKILQNGYRLREVLLGVVHCPNILADDIDLGLCLVCFLQDLPHRVMQLPDASFRCDELFVGFGRPLALRAQD